MSNLANAQIEYANGKLRFGGASQFMNYPICIQGGGTYWTIDNKYFQLDLSAKNPRLAGTDDKVVFYNTKTRK
ncbi:MAG: hypothetical protein K6E54_07255 [Bacteroidaceae bacterium]|nr:hypothetical protein [Bacteroidaceae bacterium]